MSLYLVAKISWIHMTINTSINIDADDVTYNMIYFMRL